jgi:hypothetical protein
MNTKRPLEHNVTIIDGKFKITRVDEGTSKMTFNIKALDANNKPTGNGTLSSMGATFAFQNEITGNCQTFSLKYAATFFKVFTKEDIKLILPELFRHQSTTSRPGVSLKMKEEHKLYKSTLLMDFNAVFRDRVKAAMKHLGAKCILNRKFTNRTGSKMVMNMWDLRHSVLID